MKKNYFTVLSIILSLCCNVFSINRTFAKADPTPITIQVFLEPPYPLELAAYLELDERLIVNVTNTSSESQNIKLALTINGPGGLTLPSQSAMDEPLVLAAGETRAFTGGEIQEMIDINEDDVEYGEYSRDDIINSGMLPEGDYTICVAAFDFDTDQRLSAGAPDDCYDFALNYAERPEIISPDHESTLSDVEINPLIVSWSDPAYALYGDEDIEIEYRLEMIDLADVDYPGTPLEGLFEPGAPLFYDETVESSGTGFTSYNVEDQDFEQGHSYAVRVTANDLNNHIAYRNGGHSEVHVFTVSGDNGSCSVTDPDFDFQVENIYPTDHDTLPFSFIPCVIEITPHCENYTNFSYHHVAVEESETPGPGYDRLVVDIWPHGPRDYLVNHIGAEEPVGDRPWQFITNLREEQESSMPLVRGKKYNWVVINPTVQVGDETAVADELSEDYVYGMTKPVLSIPENEDTLAPGDINFGFNKGTAPDNLLPETVKLLAVDLGEVEGAQNIGNIRERWVLQVATTQEFHPDDIVFGSTGLVDASSDLDEYDIRETVYGSESLNNEFTEEGDYWWRVIWLKNPDMEVPENHFISNEDFYLSSPVWKFTIHSGGGGGSGEEEEEEEPVAGCDSDCHYTNEIAQTNISSLNTGDTVKVGQFKMVLTEISHSGETFSGEGAVILPFFGNKKLLVEFENIKVNENHRMWDGTVNGREEEPSGFLAELTGTGEHEIPQLGGESRVNDLMNWLHDHNHILGMIPDGDDEIGIPLGINTEYGDDNPITLAIMKTEFHPDVAFLSAIAAVGVEEINSVLNFGVNTCFNPGGFSNDSITFYQPYDLHFDYFGDEDNYGITFKGAEGSSIDDVMSGDDVNFCYARFGCNMRFISAQLVVEADLPRDKFVPVNEEDNTMSDDEDEYVKLRGFARYTRNKGILIGLDIDPFFINDFDVFYFSADNAWLDFSTEENPPGFEFPDRYDRGSFTGDMTNAWKGFYMQQIGLHIGPGIYDYSGELNIGADNIIIDNTGITFTLGASNIITAENDASIADWQATLDRIGITVVQNSFEGFEVRGRIIPPIADDTGFLNYSLILGAREESDEHSDVCPSSGEGERSYYIQMDADDDVAIKMPALSAQVVINDNSFLRIGVDGDGVYICSDFSGNLSISDRNNDEEDSPSMDIDLVEFQGLKINSRHDPWLICDDCFHTALSSPQHTASGFPITLENISFGMEDEYFYFQVGLRLNISRSSNSAEADETNTFGGGTTLKFYCEFRDVDGRSKLRLREDNPIVLAGVEIHCEFSGFTLDGSISHEKTIDLEQWSGNLELGTRMFTVGFAAIFGTKKDPGATRADFNTERYYNFWYVYASLRMSEGIVSIPPAFKLYAIGGGLYYHMRLNDAQEVSGNALFNGTDIDPARLYTNEFDALIGFKVNAVIGMEGSSSAANLEVGIMAEFSGSQGLTRFGVAGKINIMSEMGENSEILHGEVSFDYRKNDDGSKEFHANFNVTLNIIDVLRGGLGNNKLAEAEFYSNTGTHIWYLHMGSYDAIHGITDGAKLAIYLIGEEPLAEVNAYLLAGYGIPNELPPPPDMIQRLCGMGSTGSQSKGGQTVESEVEADPDGPDYESGTRPATMAEKFTDPTNPNFGFAFGCHLGVHTEIDAFIYFFLNIELGFDLLVEKMNYTCVGYDPSGIKGWYSHGQAYLGLEGGLGLKIHFFGEKKIPILELGLAMYMRGEFPNPNYFEGRAGVSFSVLGGLIEGHKTMHVELGEKCERVTRIEDPLANIKFISDVKPDETDVTVFSAPAVSFNFPMREHMKFPQYISEETGLPIEPWYDFVPYVNKFETRDRDHHLITGEEIISPDYKKIKLIPDEILPGESSFQIETEIKVRDFTIGSTHYRGDYHNDDGTVWREDTLVTFSTGPAPSVIPEENVLYTYPFRGQKHFLQNESRHKGLIKMGQGMRYLFNTVDSDGDYGNPDEEYEYKARFVNIESARSLADAVETPIHYTGGRVIELTIPHLENKAIYYCQILRVPKNIDEVSINDANDRNPFANQGQDKYNGNKDGNESSKERITYKNGLKIHEKILSPDDFINKREKRLYQFYFKTSKYNTLSQKLRGIDIDGRTPSLRTGIYANTIADIQLENLDEKFNQVELFGKMFSCRSRDEYVPPLFAPYYITGNTYWREVIEPKYALANEMKSFQTIRHVEEYETEVCNENNCTRIEYDTYIDQCEKSFNNSWAKVGIYSQNAYSNVLTNEEIEDGWTPDDENTTNTTINPTMLMGGLFDNLGITRIEPEFYTPSSDRLLLEFDVAQIVYDSFWRGYRNIWALELVRSNTWLTIYSGRNIYTRHHVFTMLPEVWISEKYPERYSQINYMKSLYTPAFYYYTDPGRNRYSIRFKYKLPRDIRTRSRGTIKSFHLIEDRDRIPEPEEYEGLY